MQIAESGGEKYQARAEGYAEKRRRTDCGTNTCDAGK